MPLRLRGVLGRDGLRQRLPLVVRQPLGVLRLVGQVEVGPHAHDDGQQTLDQEHPLNAAKSEQPVELEQSARQRVAQDAGERDAHVEVTARPAQVPRGDPIGEEEDDAGKEARLGDTQQEPQDVEARRPLHEHEGGRDDAPAHHDPGQPPARPDLVQQEVAGNLEDGVADEEEAGAEGVRGGADAEVDLELLLRERDVAAVQERDHVHQQEERDQPAEHLLRRVLAQVVAALGGGRGAVSHVVSLFVMAGSRLVIGFQGLLGSL